MKKQITAILITCILLTGCTPAPKETTKTKEQKASTINPKGETLKYRFSPPEGYTRVESKSGTFASYLQTLPLKPDGSKVLYFDGREKTKDVYLAVVDFTLGDRDLQQCADAVMRLRAEYLYSTEQWNKIHFNFVNGFKADFSKWADGYGIAIDNNDVSWVTNNNHDRSYDSFQQYLDVVYAYSSTLSLEKELTTKNIKDLAIGDVFIIGGSPGHCVIVVDMAVNNQTGEKKFMLAQSYMPAQDIQILKGESDDSPWYTLDVTKDLQTPEWTFQVDQLRTWE